MSVDIEKYGEQYYKDYLNEDFEFKMVYYRKKHVIELMTKYHARKILEIGCGMDPIFLSYPQYEQMTIVEPATIMYESAVTHAKGKKNITLIHDFVENSIENGVGELLNAEFDFILCLGLLHEVADPKKLLECVRKLCHKDTKLLVSTRNPKSMHLLLAYEAGIIPQLDVLSERAKSLQQQQPLDMEHMKKLLKCYNLDIIEEGSFFIKPFAHSQMKALLDNGIISPKVLDGLDNMTKYLPDMGAEIFCVTKPSA